MYCPSCGKNVPDGSNFCLHCGSSMTAPIATSGTQVEWEYQDYVRTWKPGQGGKYYLADGKNENTIRLQNWNEDQSWILPEIQDWLDKGWQPVTQVGPGAYTYSHHSGGLFGWSHLEATEFRVKMRKPKHISK